MNGPILADIFMAKLENGPLTSMMDQLHFYCRYVDDTFVVCKNTVDIPYLVSVANNAHRAIQLRINQTEVQYYLTVKTIKKQSLTNIRTPMVT